MSETPAQRRQRVVDLAAELSAHDEIRRDDAARDAAVASALGEAGIDPKWMAEAEIELRRRDADEAARRASQRRWMTGGAAMVAVVGVAVVGVVVMAPTPAEPWASGFDVPAEWALDVNPGTKATVVWVAEQGHGQVASIDVEAFSVEGGKHRVNFNSMAVPGSFEGYTEMTVDLKGSLPVARVYLEAGSDERWRSPALSVTSEWATSTVGLSSFDHQVRRDGSWKTVAWEAPAGVQTISVKFGDFMNPPDASGRVMVDDLGFR